MKKEFMSDMELRPYFEKMLYRAENEIAFSVQFGIEDLLTTDEWNEVTNYGHITLGQFFRSYVDRGKVKGVRPCQDQTSKATQYVRVQ